MIDKDVMVMTTAEREAKAVAEHRCPYCGRKPGQKCIRMQARGWAAVELPHPHKARLEWVPS